MEVAFHPAQLERAVVDTVPKDDAVQLYARVNEIFTAESVSVMVSGLVL